MSNAAEDLILFLNEISTKSIAGEIPWTQPNPSTFQWEQKKDGERYVVLIQKAVGGLGFGSKGLEMAAKPTYLFQVKKGAIGQVLMSITSAQRPELYDALANIFMSALKGIDIRSSQVLKKLLS